MYKKEFKLLYKHDRYIDIRRTFKLNNIKYSDNDIVIDSIDNSVVNYLKKFYNRHRIFFLTDRKDIYYDCLKIVIKDIYKSQGKWKEFTILRIM